MFYTDILYLPLNMMKDTPIDRHSFLIIGTTNATETSRNILNIHKTENNKHIYIKISSYEISIGDKQLKSRFNKKTKGPTLERQNQQWLPMPKGEHSVLIILEL